MRRAFSKGNFESLRNLRHRSRRRGSTDTWRTDGTESGGGASGGAGATYDFLKKDKSKDKSSLQGGDKWWRYVFLFSCIGFVACLVTLWAPYPIGARQTSEEVASTPWSNGCQGLETCICPRETICADDRLSMIFLTLARASAWFDYPLYMLLFLTKARNLNNFLQKTMLKCWINFSDCHKVHSLFGLVVGVESASHAFFHILRWSRRKDDIRLLWSHPTGITGLISLLVCPIIVLPMALPFMKEKIAFEWRKGLHYLSILWGACLMFHAPQRIFWLVGVPLVVYVADRLYGVFHATNLVENAYFERLGDSSLTITFENPKGFERQNSAYVYLMLPWLSKYQFHPFSVYPSQKPNHSQLCISKSGGWTGDLMAEITTPFHKPAFIVGPFLSPFSPSMNSEHIIAVASGIGVTPTISLIKQYQYTSRRLNLIWICRDPGLVEWFLENVSLPDKGYGLIYYTGKRSLAVFEKDPPANVFIYKGRPNLAEAISGIIVSVASGEGPPESTNERLATTPNSKTAPEMRAKLLLEKAMSVFTTDQLFSHALEVSNESLKAMGLETQTDTVDYRGVRSLMEKLLKENFKFMEDELMEHYDLCSSREGLLDQFQFKALLHRMAKSAEENGVSLIR
ncbi:hypothetical protein ACHAWF_015458 [Thalassiosira exigua]